MQRIYAFAKDYMLISVQYSLMTWDGTSLKSRQVTKEEAMDPDFMQIFEDMEVKQSAATSGKHSV